MNDGEDGVDRSVFFVIGAVGRRGHDGRGGMRVEDEMDGVVKNK